MTCQGCTALLQTERPAPDSSFSLMSTVTLTTHCNGSSLGLQLQRHLIQGGILSTINVVTYHIASGSHLFWHVNNIHLLVEMQLDEFNIVSIQMIGLLVLLFVYTLEAIFID